VNIPTLGGEAQVPFGGVKDSGSAIANAARRRSTSSRSYAWCMSAISGRIVDIEGDAAVVDGYERRRAILLGFALCLAVGSAAVGRDGPLAIAPIDEPHILALPPRTADAHLYTMPDRLANEPLTNLPFAAVSVRRTEGLAARVGSPGGVWLVTWTEGGTAYWLSSEHRDLSDLLHLAGSLR